MGKGKEEWKVYEEDIHSLLKEQFPESVVKSNCSITGRFSNRKRQIDVLVEGFTGGRKFRQIVECKHYNKKINIKIVESILGFLDDVAADRAIIITNKGYTKSAYKRALNDPRFIELQICSFTELKQHQGLFAMCYRGSNGLIVKAPIGWVTDNQHIGNETVCNLYLRGKTIEEASRERDLIFVNIFNKAFSGITNLNTFQRDRNKRLKEAHSSAEITVLDPISRYDGTTTLDRIFSSDLGLQFSGYIEFDEFIVTLDLVTNLDQEANRLPIIEQLLFEVKPYQTVFKNDIDAALWNLRNAYESTKDEEYKKIVFDDLKGIISIVKANYKDDIELVEQHFKEFPEVLELLK